MRIFAMVDAQKDFMEPSGALYVPEAEKIIPAIRKLTDVAVKYRIPILASVDEHTGLAADKEKEIELSCWGGPFPDHCMKGTYGATLIQELKYTRGTIDSLPWLTYTHRGVEELSGWDGKNHCPIDAVVYPKQTYDVFKDTAFAYHVYQLRPTEAYVYGVATDYCVKAAVLGLRRMGIPTCLVMDAIAGVDKKTTAAALMQMHVAGTAGINSEDLIRSMDAMYGGDK